MNRVDFFPTPEGPGKTYKTIQALQEFVQTDLTIERTYDLAQFSLQLSHHLEGSIQRRYSILSWLVLFISKRWGILQQLSTLKTAFDAAVSVKKERLIQQEPNPKNLASIFYVDPDFLTHDPKVNRCYKMLHEQKLFPAYETIQLALFITHTPLTKSYYKKGGDLPRSFHRDPETGTIFIRNKAVKVAATDVKSVAKALLYRPEEARVIAQLTTTDTLSDSMRERTFNEYSTYKKLQECPGRWPMLHAAKYTKQKNGKEKVVLFSELAKGDFEKVARHATFDELVAYSKTLLEALAWLHTRDLLHVDVKGANALIGETAGWIDLSFTGSLQDPKIINRLKTGHYGTRSFTAPELFGVEGFRSRQKEAEMWAFGLMLFQARFKKYPNWFALKLTDKDKVMTEGLKEAYKKAISDEVLPALEKLLAKPLRSREEQFDLLIYQLLHPDPLKRLSATGALEALLHIAI
ncbi:MAG: protein kinase [Verrucomicrobia bacterium]|nr:protein kinase [Verrucomicrobiota bacterium]MBS0637887.1 protein kinase [Verrucomicrobiota bacterium]